MDDETLETNVTDLSSWLGKPSEVAKLPQSQVVLSGDDDASESSAQQSDAGARKFEDGGYTRQISAMSRTRSGGKVGSIKAVGKPSPVRPRQNGVYIDVPEISDPDEYEYLPSHHDVEKILSEYSQNRFLVKLASGERELVSLLSSRYLLSSFLLYLTPAIQPFMKLISTFLAFIKTTSLYKSRSLSSQGVFICQYGLAKSAHPKETQRNQHGRLAQLRYL
jgi:hypothetical protein